MKTLPLDAEQGFSISEWLIANGLSESEVHDMLENAVVSKFSMETKEAAK